MTYFPLQPRYFIYTDSLGDPLDNGYIYLGDANLDPMLYPAKASWDQAGLYPISFPVRTRNGYPIRNGNIAQIFLALEDNFEYSALIQDEDEATVFSSATGLSGYFPASSGGDAATLGGELPSYYAEDSLVVHLAGAETVTGPKTFKTDTYFLPVSTSLTDYGTIGVFEERQAYRQAIGIALTNSETAFSGRQSTFLGCCNSGSAFYLSGGAQVTDNPQATLWATPTTTSAEFFAGRGGVFYWYGDTGLTEAVAYTPTLNMTLSASGNLAVTGSISDSVGTVMHLAGAETVTGVKNFTGTVGINNASPVADLEIDGKIRTTKTSIFTGAEVFDTANATLIGNQNQDSCVFQNSASSVGDGNYGGSVSLIGPGGTRRSTAIVSKQVGADSDQVGIAFFTHASISGTDPLIEQVVISPDGDLSVTGSISDSVGTVMHLAGTETVTGPKTFNADITLGTGAQIDFFDEVGDKIYLYQNAFGIGIEADNLTNWSSLNFRWRTGGTSVSTGTEVMVLTSTGNLYVDGQVIINNAQTGDSIIQFNDVTNATLRSLFWDDSASDWYVEDSSGVNRTIWHAGNLDFEESTFTPVLEGGTTAGTGTYSQAFGRYQKVGNWVHFRLQMIWTAHTGTGDMIISGLPYTAHAEKESAVTIIPNNLTYTGGMITGFVYQGTQDIYLYNAASGAALSGVTMDTAGAIYIAGSYEIA